jgi:hypothetical protein
MPIRFSGPGVSGSLEITIGRARRKILKCLEITGVRGTFSDTNNGLDIARCVGQPISILSPPSAPESTNLLAPHDFSKFAVASGLPVMSNGFVTYDNLFWPGNAPATASDFPGAGTFLDIYGLAFTIGGGTVVDLFSYGLGFGPPGAVFGVAVVTSHRTLY